MPLLKIADLQMAYDDEGSGPTLLLLHGFPFNRSLWKQQIAVIRQTHRVICPDLRGFGDTDASTGPATMNRMAQDVALLMDTLNIPSAIMGGLSMGGYVVLAFCKQFDARVNALVLADTRPQADSEEAKHQRSVQAEQALAEGMGPIADGMLPKLLTPETVTKRPQVVKQVRDMIMTTKPAGAAAALTGMALREDQTPWISNIKVPTLILVGREDAITPVKDSKTMHERILDSRLAIIENAGHVSNLEQPETFNAEVTRFLNQLN
jgi:3-oxoadipate enol-lactonase